MALLQHYVTFVFRNDPEDKAIHIELSTTRHTAGATLCGRSVEGSHMQRVVASMPLGYFCAACLGYMSVVALIDAGQARPMTAPKQVSEAAEAVCGGYTVINGEYFVCNLPPGHAAPHDLPPAAAPAQAERDPGQAGVLPRHVKTERGYMCGAPGRVERRGFEDTVDVACLYTPGHGGLHSWERIVHHDL